MTYDFAYTECPHERITGVRIQISKDAREYVLSRLLPSTIYFIRLTPVVGRLRAEARLRVITLPACKYS